MKNGSMENLEMKRIVAACAGAWSPRLASSAWQQVLPGLLRFCQCLLQIQMPRPEPPQSLNLQVDPTGHSQGFLDLRSVPFNQKCRSKWFEMCYSLSHALKVQSTKACLGQREFSQLESRVSRSIHYDHDVGHGNIKQGQGIRTWKRSGNIQSYICKWLSMQPGSCMNVPKSTWVISRFENTENPGSCYPPQWAL
jgi:hypothetical protein